MLRIVRKVQKVEGEIFKGAFAICEVTNDLINPKKIIRIFQVNS